MKVNTLCLYLNFSQMNLLLEKVPELAVMASEAFHSPTVQMI